MKIKCNKCLWYDLKGHICTQGRKWKIQVPLNTCFRAKEFTVPRIAAEAKRKSCPFI